jgi:hypothetical protein
LEATSVDAFLARAKATAEAEGAASIVFGGLPDSELMDSASLQRHHPELQLFEIGAAL